jgi:ATP-dependent DNA helicase DinG
MNASERFSDEAAARLRREIEENGGNEVFAACRLGEDGRIAEVLVVARGSDSAVPALEAYFERGDVIVHNHPSGTLRPSDADVAIAAEAGSAGVGSYIVNNAVSRVHVVAEPARRKSFVMLDEDEIAGVLEEGGKLSTLIESYEPRTSQIKLARGITASLNEGRVFVAEAGTGVGKSFAYLIPAFAWAITNEERVVVSTATINLQKQLIDKDIPVVQRLFRKKTKAVLVKGRGNYLCRLRLAEALDEEGLLANDDHPLRHIEAWAQSTATGDRADLSFYPDESLWSRVCSESDACLGLRCPRREDCFVLRARREASEAQVVVANHHILFADLSRRMNGAGYEITAVLPAFRALVIDEAHAIEASATGFFSTELTKFSLNKRLSRLFRRSGRRRFGILPRLEELHAYPSSLLDKIPASILEARRAMAELDEHALRLLGGSGGIAAADRGVRSERTYRLVEHTSETDAYLIRPIAALETALLACADHLGDVLDETPEALAQERVVYEARIFLRWLSELASFCAKFKDFKEHPETVFWLEQGKTAQGEPFVRYTQTPLDITALMDEALFSKLRSVICTSATLSVGESFSFWKSRVGLLHTNAQVEEASYPSPFPFKTNALLAIDTGAPGPERTEYRGYVERAVLRLLEASQGHALVLFTSHEAMRNAYEAARPRLAELGINALRQGQDDRSRLLEAFKSDLSSVLFATDSFWEGIDAPGETLQLVIISKLPFRVPTDPVQLARSEAVERRGGNAFMEISLPEAVIRLKQGFGRLIRHSEDRGVVAILDSRIASKYYGRLFVQSLPECRLVADTLEVIEKEVAKFLFDW